MNDARYHSISLEVDDTQQTGVYKLKFSTGPGMSTAIRSLRMGDLDALAGILGDRANVTDFTPIIAFRADSNEHEEQDHHG